MRRDKNTAGRKMIAAQLERMSFWLSPSLPLSLWLPQLSAQTRAFVFSGRPYVHVPRACGCWNCTEVSGLFCKQKSSVGVTLTGAVLGLDYLRCVFARYGCFLFKNPDGSEIYFYHPFSAGSRVNVFTCVSLPDLMRPSTYAFFKSRSQRSNSHSVLHIRDVLARTRGGALGQRL